MQTVASAVRLLGRQFDRRLNLGLRSLDMSPAVLRHPAEVLAVAAGELVIARLKKAQLLDQTTLIGKSLERHGERTGDQRILHGDRLFPTIAFEVLDRD